MLFNSLNFLIFFPVVVLVYYIVPKKIRYIWLLISSYYFYMSWNIKYSLLILFSTIITYISGLMIENIKISSWNNAQKKKYNKTIVGISFFLNLAMLFYFKYFNFSMNIVNKITQMFQIEWNVPNFDIVLPVGISFYTFQALGYIIDVYRDEVYAEKNFFRYALFVSFFPQLVAGPIERTKNLLQQLADQKRFNFELAKEGFLLMLWGFFLKIVLADRIALFVDTIYGDYSTFGGGYLVVATILFAIQIYCDFYGYSIIAMGSAQILGIQLMENFDAPYLSVSIAEFWRKWHISLTSWFKDYVYIPLGGNQKGKLHKYFNKLIVFLVSGLWHGASFSFVVWGGLNGIYQIIGEASQPLRDKWIKFLHLNRNSLAHKLMQMVITFLFVDFSWIFFRANGFKEAVEIIKNICKVKNPWIFFDGSLYKCGLNSKNFWLMIICISILLFADYCKNHHIKIRKVILEQDYWFRWMFISISVCIILILGVWGTNYDVNGFIYFQF